jgi:RluA family pseudouridine synthase
MARQPALPILQQDHDLVIVDKPAGLATIPGRGEASSVLQVLAEQLNLPDAGTTDPRIRVVHRLDKETSGVLLFAKHVAAQRFLSHQFQNNAVVKEYLAIIAGNPQSDSGEIDASIAPHPTIKGRMVISRQGRPARTLWRVETRFRRYSVLRCFPKTGKTHQIRVHLASIGLPLAVDPVYNARAGELFLSHFKHDYRTNRQGVERPLIARLTLHAEKLSFDSPSGQRIQAAAMLPKDFRAAWNQLQRHG